MRVITLNVNGIRAAERKGFFEWLTIQDPDIVCLQEIKAHQEQLATHIFYPSGYHCFYHDAHKKGYSGVALFTKRQPLRVKYGLGWEVADTEGRYVEAEFDDFIIASVYLPSGSSSEARQAIKFDFMQQYLPYLQGLIAGKKECILCGDWNIAHKEIDLKNWRSNQKSSGFLPEERAWLNGLLTQEGFVDAFRLLNQEPEQYTWWSNRRQAWAKNVGWRIDYQIITPGLRSHVNQVSIYKAHRFSDHAPVIVDYTC